MITTRRIYDEQWIGMGEFPDGNDAEVAVAGAAAKSTAEASGPGSSVTFALHARADRRAARAGAFALLGSK